MQINLGKNIRKRRKNAGLTQEQLAEVLGVTTGAVYKWESGRAVPELEMLVDIAEFFETSVDALLDYGWEKLSMGQTAQKLRRYLAEKELQEGIRYAQKALQKYPNSFEVVLKSAEIHLLTMEPQNMPRALELFEKALQLIDQNTDDKINAMTIQNQIAYCYGYMDRIDDAIALFQKNNANGVNDFRIGMLMSQDPNKAEESLKYLSDALSRC